MGFLRQTPSIASGKPDDSEKTSFDRSAFGSMSGLDLETTNEPLQKEEPIPQPVSTTDEPKWPTGWRPYTCLFGGFLLMFNSWGIVNVCELGNQKERQQLIISRHTGPSLRTICSTCFLVETYFS